MEIEVIKKCQGSEDGTTVKTFDCGIQDIKDDLAVVFLNLNWAKKVKAVEIGKVLTEELKQDNIVIPELNKKKKPTKRRKK